MGSLQACFIASQIPNRKASEVVKMPGWIEVLIGWVVLGVILAIGAARWFKAQREYDERDERNRNAGKSNGSSNPHRRI
jgi:hypothetical protein